MSRHCSKPPCFPNLSSGSLWENPEVSGWPQMMIMPGESQDFPGDILAEYTRYVSSFVEKSKSCQTLKKPSVSITGSFVRVFTYCSPLRRWALIQTPQKQGADPRPNPRLAESWGGKAEARRASGLCCLKYIRWDAMSQSSLQPDWYSLMLHVIGPGGWPNINPPYKGPGAQNGRKLYWPQSHFQSQILLASSRLGSFLEMHSRDALRGGSELTPSLENYFPPKMELPAVGWIVASKMPVC